MLLTSAVLLALTMIPGHNAKHLPKWFEFKVAGYILLNGEQEAIYDPKTHFMLIRQNDCDGADVTVLLTRDRREVSTLGFNVPGMPANSPEYDDMKVKSLPSLSTGKGVAIGDSPLELISKLGEPKSTDHSGSRNQFLNYTYSLQVGKGEEAVSYEQTYTFKAGHLIEMNFTKGPGEGYTDLAVIEPKARRLRKDKTRN